jgi:hypothetical protein
MSRPEDQPTTHIFGSSRDRHAREAAARAAAVFGGSREGVRQAKVVAHSAPALAAQVKAGEVSLNAAYRQAIGETRRPLYLQLPAWLDEQLRAAATELEMSPQTLTRIALVQFLAPDEDAGGEQP